MVPMPQAESITILRDKLHARMTALRRGGAQAEPDGKDELLEERRKHRAAMREKRRKETRERKRAEAEEKKKGKAKAAAPPKVSVFVSNTDIFTVSKPATGLRPISLYWSFKKSARFCCKRYIVHRRWLDKQKGCPAQVVK